MSTSLQVKINDPRFTPQQFTIIGKQSNTITTQLWSTNTNYISISIVPLMTGTNVKLSRVSITGTFTGGGATDVTISSGNPYALSLMVTKTTLNPPADNRIIITIS